MFKPLCKVVTLITIALLWLSPLQAATYMVSSSQCSGPDSIVAAIDQANLNPGTDTIEFASGLQVNSINTGGCELPANTFPQDLFLGIVTEDVVINGNGAQLIGAPFWIDDGGSSNIVGECPSNPDVRGSIVREAPGFLRVEPGVSVTVNDLTALDLSAYIRMESGSTVDLNNVEARRINDWYRDCKRQAIEAPFGSVTLTITDSYFEQIQNDQLVFGSPDATVFRGSNMVSGTGSLTVTGTRFEDTPSAIQWSGDANIETSRFVDTGWINAFGPGTTNIVNSVFQGKSKNSGDLNSVRASGGAIVNIKASSLSLLDSECPAACKSGFGALVATTGGAINLEESALGVGLPTALPGGSFGVILRTAGGTITSDVSSWIQPTLIQPADDLKAITGQPLLLTDVPGLPTIADGALFFFPFPNALTPLLGTAGNPGVLIDVIADAGAGGANELISPIDGSTITADALGNPRVDGNGRRNIGGVQLQLAPHLNVVNTGDGTVDLSWSRPLDPNSGAISGYDLCYGIGTPPDPSLTSCVGGTVETVSGPDSLSSQVNALTNGTTYWFQLRGINPNPGPWSNQVTAIPATVPDTPVVSAFPSAGSVQLSWTTPNDQGSALTGYVVEYRPAGATTWQLTSFTGLGTSFTVGGLTDLTSYEFSVVATNAIGSSSRGQVTATPRPAPYVSYADVTGFENNALTIYPTYANVYGTSAYSLVSGTLPAGMTLSGMNGEISGTPITAGSYPLTIELTDSSFPTPVQAMFTVTISANPPALTANYDNYAGPAGSALGSPLRPNVTGSTGALSFTLNGGDPLPSGLVLNTTTGEISGTPDTATGRVFSLNMEITDSSGTINEPFNIEITPTLFYPATQGILGDALSASPNTSLAVTPGTYQLVAGQVLPAGLNLDSATGSITGTPEVAGLFTVMIEYTTNLQTATAHASITIDSYSISVSYPPIVSEIGQAITISPTVTGLKGTATYSIESGSLPAGLMLDPATGAISGTPTGSPTNSVLVIAVADLYGFASAQVLINLIAPAARPVPTLQSWGVIVLIFFIAGMGLRQSRKKREAMESTI